MRHRRHRLGYVLAGLIAVTLVHAQEASSGQGTIAGKVTAAESGAAVADAFISVPGHEGSAISDANGAFSINVPAGTHDLMIEKSGFAAEVVPSLNVTAGKTVTANAALKTEVEQVLVLGRGFIEGSEASALAIQQEAKSLLEVVGSEEFSRLGDSSAADTLQRVTGLTVQEGKFVVIRGQPARYSSTLFNGSQMPSLDPIQTITPLDLFPSSVLANVSVQKAFTAERPGSFGAGQVQLKTSGLPAEDFAEIKLGTGVNFESIDSEPLEFATGDDLIGEIDEGLLRIPRDIVRLQNAGTAIASLPQAQQAALAKQFPVELAPGYADEGPDFSLELNGGKRIETDLATLGATASFSYGQNMRTQDERRRQLRLGADGEEIEDDFLIDRSRLNTEMNAFVGLTGIQDVHELNFNFFWVRDTTERTEKRDGQELVEERFKREFLLEIQQRQMFIHQVTGSHEFPLFDLAYRGMYAKATRELPDRREYVLQNTLFDGTGDFFLDNNQAPHLLRRWNSVDEKTWSGGIDVSIPVTEHFSIDAPVKLELQGGVDKESRDRESDTRSFGFNTSGDLFRPIEQIFAASNMGTEVRFTEFGGVADDYVADFDIEGSYVQTDWTFWDRLRLILGIRFEEAEFVVTTFEAGTASDTPEIQSGFIRRDELPSFIGSYSITDSMQLRAGAARSLSYPSPIELSATTFIDPDSDQRFLGNPDLEPVVIDSYDVRWEWYPTAIEALTVGFFYKDMSDPIERSFNPVAGSVPIVTFINAEQGEVIGVELNGRVGLGRLRDLAGETPWLPSWLEDMHFAANVTYQDSEVTLDPEGNASTNLKRRMTGQPEILANVQLGYTGDRHVFTIAAGYQSDRLINAGVQGMPDEFIEPRISLGGKWSWTIIDPLTMSLELENVVNDAYQRSQGRFLTRDWKTGVTGSFSLKWRFD